MKMQQNRGSNEDLGGANNSVKSNDGSIGDHAENDMRYEAYMSLLDCRIRNAYVSPFLALWHPILRLNYAALYSLPMQIKFLVNHPTPLYRISNIKFHRKACSVSTATRHCPV